MVKQSRMGADPLSWIQDSRGEKNTTHQELQGLHELQRNSKNSSHTGLKNEWRRATFIVKEPLLEKLKDIAYWERKTIKEVINNLLEGYLKSKNPKPRPKDD